MFSIITHSFFKKIGFFREPKLFISDIKLRTCSGTLIFKISKIMTRAQCQASMFSSLLDMVLLYFSEVLPGKHSWGRATRSRSLGTDTFSVELSLVFTFPGATADLSLFFLMKDRLRWPRLKFPTPGSAMFSFVTNGGTWTCKISGSSRGRGTPFSCWENTPHTGLGGAYITLESLRDKLLSGFVFFPPF